MLSLRESCQAIWNTAVMYAGKHPWSLLLALAACLYLLVASPDFRKKLLLPVVLLLVLVLNPVLYSLVYGNNRLPFVNGYGLRYWRFFWLLPQAIVIGLAATDILRRLASSLTRCTALAVAAGIILLSGPSLYENEKLFEPTVSAYKLKKNVITVCEAILADDPHPMCLLDKTLSAQVREYSGDIHQVWGRAGVWNLVSDPEALEVYRVLRKKPRDWERIFSFARERGVTHLCFPVYKGERKALLKAAKENGYDLLRRYGWRYLLHRTDA